MSFKTLAKSRSAQQLEEGVEDYKRQLSYDEGQLAASIENGYKMTFTDRARLKDLKYKINVLETRLQEVRKQNNQRQATYRARNSRKSSNSVDAAAIIEATIKGTAELYRAMYQGGNRPHGSLRIAPEVETVMPTRNGIVPPGVPTGNRFIDLVNMEGKSTEEAKQILEDEARAKDQAQTDELLNSMRTKTVGEVEETIKDSIADIDPTDI
jgi:hypothetical protein